jgi:hypothetical protein
MGYIEPGILILCRQRTTGLGLMAPIGAPKREDLNENFPSPQAPFERRDLSCSPTVTHPTGSKEAQQKILIDIGASSKQKKHTG